jgi:hypothetical protein
MRSTAGDSFYRESGPASPRRTCPRISPLGKVAVCMLGYDSIAVFYSGLHSRIEYVHMNMKSRLFYFWKRISRKLTGKPQQLELNLWSRRSMR